LGSEEVVYLTPAKGRARRLVGEGLRRVLAVVVSPFATYEDIGSEPEFFGPCILIAASLLLALLDRYVALSASSYVRGAASAAEPVVKVLGGYFVVSYAGNVTELPSARLQPSSPVLLRALDSVLTLALAGLGLRLVTLYIVAALTALGLRGGTRGMLAATCYTLSVAVIQQAAGVALKAVALSQVRGIVVVLPPEEAPAKDLRLILSGVTAWLSAQASYAQAMSLVSWAASLWQLVMLVALFMGVSRLSLTRSIIAAIATYAVTSLVLAPMYAALLRLG